jgi:hypothetical protein
VIKRAWLRSKTKLLLCGINFISSLIHSFWVMPKTVGSHWQHSSMIHFSHTHTYQSVRVAQCSKLSSRITNPSWPRSSCCQVISLTASTNGWMLKIQISNPSPNLPLDFKPPCIQKALQSYSQAHTHHLYPQTSSGMAAVCAQGYQIISPNLHPYLVLRM